MIESNTNSKVVNKIDEWSKLVSFGNNFFSIPGLGFDIMLLTFTGVDTVAHFSHVDSSSIEIKEDIFSEDVYYKTIDVRYSKIVSAVNT